MACVPVLVAYSNVPQPSASKRGADQDAVGIDTRTAEQSAHGDGAEGGEQFLDESGVQAVHRRHARP
jgi:hypothetical protein